MFLTIKNNKKIILRIIIIIIFIFILLPIFLKIEKSNPNKSSLYFQNLIKEDKYQVLIFNCPAYFPVNFARHPWFVVNKMGVLSRYEVRQEKQENNSHFFIDAEPIFQGINVSYIGKQYFWKPELLGYLEGDQNSDVKKMIDFIENSNQSYPYVYEYSLLGPNSNTYFAWVLNAFPESNMKLSWRFIGKNYK